MEHAAAIRAAALACAACYCLVESSFMSSYASMQMWLLRVTVKAAVAVSISHIHS